MDPRPIDDSNYNPISNNINKEDSDDEEDFNNHQEHGHPPQQHPMYMSHPFPPQDIHMNGDAKGKDLFGDLDKTAYVVIFVAFILGFFMGKTMQPVILRPT